VHIGSDATVGRFDTAVLNLSTACRDKAIVAELTVQVTQGDLTGSRSGVFGIVCDGRTHRVLVEVSSSTGGPFNAALVHVDALLTVLDPDSMDPLPQGRDSADVRLLPAAQVRIGSPVHLTRGGSAIVPIWTKCQRPWVDAGLDVDVSQGMTGGSAFVGDGAIVCDAHWHFRLVRAVPTSPFTRGSVHIDVFLTVYAPVDFDPVDQARASADRRIFR
jgi:hypothetical protein